MTSIFKRKGRKGYTIEYRDPSTLRLKQRSFPTKTEAKHFEDRVRAKARDLDGLEMDVDFAEYASTWLAATRTAVRHATGVNYTWAVRRHLIPAFHGRTVRGITAKMVRDLIVSKRATLKKNTVSSIRKALHQIFEAAVEERVVTANPAKFRSRSKLMRMGPTHGERRVRVQAMTEDQARRFITAAPAAAPLHWMMYRTQLVSGLRPGEAQGLQPHDVEAAEARLRLEREVTADGRLEPCKTSADGAWEYVDIPQAHVEELRAWTADHPDARWLFPDESGGHLDRDSNRAAFVRVLAAAGLPKHFTPKSLRHTYATLALIAGEPIYWVSRQLRHSDISITVKTYGSWLPTGNRAAADRAFARLLGHGNVSI